MKKNCTLITNLKITGILNNVFRPQINPKDNNKIIKYTSPSSFVIW